MIPCGGIMGAWSGIDARISRLRPGDTKKGTWDGHDTFWLILALLSFVAMLYVLFGPGIWWGTAWVYVGLLNFFVVLQLGLAANKKDKNTWIPHRMPALLLLAVMLASCLLAFSRIYLDTNQVTRDVSVVTVVNDPQGKELSRTVSTATESLPSEMAALYFSLATLTTYGDAYTPKGTAAKLAVAAELVTGLMLMIFALPVLVSRLSMFDDPPKPLLIDVTRTGGELKWHKVKEDKPFYDDRLRLRVEIVGDQLVPQQDPADPPPPPPPVSLAAPGGQTG